MMETSGCTHKDHEEVAIGLSVVLFDFLLNFTGSQLLSPPLNLLVLKPTWEGGLKSKTAAALSPSDSFVKLRGKHL